MHTSTTVRYLAIAASAFAATIALSGCVPNSSATGGATTIDVESSATVCALSATTAPSGPLVFSVTNTGDQETEFYLLAEDGKTVVGEVEHIGPGTSRDLAVDADPGDYVTVCKPGMAGEGIGRADFTVVDK